MENINIINSSIRTFLVLFFEYYIFMKFINIDKPEYKVSNILFMLLVSVIAFFITEYINSFYCGMFQLFSMILINKVNFKKKIGYTIINTMISLGISYLFLFISLILIGIPIYIFKIKNDYIILVMLIFIYCLVVWRTFKIKKIKNGLIFLQNKIDDENLDILFLNVSSIFLFVAMIISGNKSVMRFFPTIIILAIMIFIIAKKSLDSYYKHKQLVKTLNEVQLELEEKNKKIEELEKENLDSSKARHTLAHKQRVLEYKINELIFKNEIGGEIGLKDEIEKLSREVYKKQAETELPKTGIPEIDDMFKLMQADAISKNIEFELQIIGNIHYMTNHFVTIKELETMIADHVKDAIIAIDYSENINKSILVKLGKIDESYGLYIYDSGIEFEKETLENIGKKPITTHEDNGGTGMGFMNTFDTLKNHKASLIIKEIGAPCKENYTKVVMFKFDEKNEFKIESYKEEIKV